VADPLTGPVVHPGPFGHGCGVLASPEPSAGATFEYATAAATAAQVRENHSMLDTPPPPELWAALVEQHLLPRAPVRPDPRA
jgi:hypothetical protein